jgi:hypothetical protein
VGTLRGSLGCDSPPKSVSKGARFWGFPSSSVRGVLGRISSIHPFWTSFGGIKLGYGLLMRCSYCPQSLAQVCGVIREIEVWIWGELTRRCCLSRAAKATPVRPVLLTRLTGATLGGFLLGRTSG